MGRNKKRGVIVLKKIGFIGLGTMGESMCENVIKKSGYEVSVFDINPVQIDKLVNAGGIRVSSIKEIGENCSIIIIMVPKSEHVKAVISDLLTSIRPGTLIVDMSTIEPEVSKELSAKVKEAGGSMVDAPVVKSKPAAIKAELGIYVGGAKEIYDKLLPILSCMGSNIIYMGDNGCGLAMKICHNMLVAQIQNGVNEMFVLAQASGIDFQDATAAISYGGGQNFYLDSKKDDILASNFSPKFSVENMHKDINIAISLAAKLNLKLKGAEVSQGVYAKSMEDKLGKEDFCATYKVVKETSRLSK